MKPSTAFGRFRGGVEFSGGVDFVDESAGDVTGSSAIECARMG